MHRDSIARCGRNISHGLILPPSLHLTPALCRGFFALPPGRVGMLVNQAMRHAPPDAWRMSRFPRIRGPCAIPWRFDHGPRPGSAQAAPRRAQVMARCRLFSRSPGRSPIARRFARKNVTCARLPARRRVRFGPRTLIIGAGLGVARCARRVILRALIIFP